MIHQCKLKDIIYQILLFIILYTYSISSKRLILSIRMCETKVHSISTLPQVLNIKLNEYLQQRRQQNDLRDPSLISNRIDEDVLRKRKSSKSSPFDMVKPSGWFKDQQALDLKARSDSKSPILPHPFSFSELKRYGYDDYYEDIVLFGGPDAVGKEIGLEWKLPPEEWDENLRPMSKETFSLDIKGELSLGGSLEDKLSSVADINIDDLKKKIATQQIVEFNSGISNNKNEDIVYNLSGQSKKPVKKYIPLKKENINPKERFTLFPKERAFMILMTSSLALGFGRATYETPFADTLQAFGHNASIGFVSLSIFSCIYSMMVANRAQRSMIMWGTLGLFGGLSVIQRLEELEPKQKQ